MRYTDQMLEALRQQGDPSIDELIPELIEKRQMEEVNHLLRGFVGTCAQLPAGLPPSLRQWMLENARLPAGADPERLARAATFHVDHAFAIYTILATASSIQIYADQRTAKHLLISDRLGYSNAEQRLSHVTRFLTGLIAPDALLPNGKGLPMVAKVRLMNAADRYVFEDASWNRESDGIPASQEELLLQWLSFARTPMQCLPRLGYTPTEAEAEDVFYFWQQIGQVMGIPAEIMPAGIAEADELQQALFRRCHGKSAEGIALTHALLATLPELFGPGNMFGGIVPAFTRWLLGGELCDLVEVPTSGWEVFMSGSTVMGRLCNPAHQPLSTLNNLVNKFGIGMLQYGIRSLKGGKEAEFQIPTELRRAWRLPETGSTEKVSTLMPQLVQGLWDKCVLPHIAKWRNTVIGLAVLVANADGSIDDLEISVLTELLAAIGSDSLEPLELKTVLKEQIALITQKGPEAFIAGLAKDLQQWQAMEEGIVLGAAVAYANSDIAAEERAVIQSLAQAGGIENQLTALVDKTRRMIEEAKAVT